MQIVDEASDVTIFQSRNISSDGICWYKFTKSSVTFNELEFKIDQLTSGTVAEIYSHDDKTDSYKLMGSVNENDIHTIALEQGHSLYLLAIPRQGVIGNVHFVVTTTSYEYYTQKTVAAALVIGIIIGVALVFCIIVVVIVVIG